MKKVRVLFPYVEAGYGHIMPLYAIEEKFKEKYGDTCEIVHCNFFADANKESLKKFKEMLVNSVVQYNKNSKFGYFSTMACEFFGTELSTIGTMILKVPGSAHDGIEYMESLHPDIVFSTHWATNYYAEKMRKKPFTISYCPDAIMNKLFQYHADLSLISMPSGYNQAIKLKKYNENNLKLVPFLIRNKAFTISSDKNENRRLLNLPENQFTIILAEGGYGIGKMQEICELLVQEHIPMTVLPICGKNEKLYEYFCHLKVSEEVCFRPQAFTEQILELIAASNLFCGKSGNIIAEPTFFGIPSIITNYAMLIEENIGKHYIETVKCAMKEFEPKKVVQMIKEFIATPSLLKPYEEAARKYHENFGAETTADLLYEIVKQKQKQLDEE